MAVKDGLRKLQAAHRRLDEEATRKADEALDEEPGEEADGERSQA